MQNPVFASLVEQASVAAVRTASDVRRRDLAQLLRAGLTKDQADLIHHEAVLRLLERLSDAQLLILMRYGSFAGTFNDPELDSFFAAHPGVFDVEPPAFGDTEEQGRSWWRYVHYENELVQLGLLEETERIAKSSRIRNLEIAPMGRILLEAIGRPVLA